MGHYRSEMGYEDEDEKRRRRKEESIRKTEQELQKAIDQDGIARVLAEIIVDASESMIFIGGRFRRYG